MNRTGTSPSAVMSSSGGGGRVAGSPSGSDRSLTSTRVLFPSVTERAMAS
jgi:hypothetical protein